LGLKFLYRGNEDADEAVVLNVFVCLCLALTVPLAAYDEKPGRDE
jgi:hypothetical protein